MSLRIGIVSLGCPRNLVDSESIVSRLKEKNFQITELEKADVVIVNTCAFIQEAKEESIDTILGLIELKKKGLVKKIIVHGCLVERYKDELVKHLGDIDAFVGRLELNGRFIVKHSLTPQHFAYVKISEGCGNLCSYCVIPKIKGKLHSRTRESIIEQVKLLDKNNTKEINLVGQDITLYGVDCCSKPQLAELIKDILKNTHNIRWIRLLYLNPGRISDELIDLIAKEERICKYIDIPIQHINNRILKLMNRNTTKSQIMSLIKKIRKRIDNVYLRTSIIAGFPTETEKEFQELINFLKEVKFERLGAFVYSREEDTKAYSFKNQIHSRTKRARFGRIMSVQREIASKLNESLLGKVKEVMIDEKDEAEKDLYLARLEQDAPEVDGTVYLKSKTKLLPGEFRKVKIIDTLEYDLVGELL
ncbi:MAG: MiaB/RimO family radical SAM methylthiotransferase [Candidatus Omnitrophica bacterium]|nr:MiaB/RimO family radical SAM methylthiotransferase [Candidatus Omnitrophota bacterium]MDD5352826.1 MiaB/RimO family radical SAM methylthiotransferase [Candidatus Omnitrophota bacterium]MDD5550425.1 MiaB/RimO family radical SAM methylthiotransferase [Candidatus Omnitrophota bacterium]